MAYALDGPLRKIGDVAALDEGRLLVIEHSPRVLGDSWSGRVYLLDLRDASLVPDGSELEALKTPEAAGASGVSLASKKLVLDLGSAGWPSGPEKPEGLAVLDARTLAVVDDNGLAAPAGDGAFVPTRPGDRSCLVPAV